MTGINNRVPTRVGELAVADSGPGEGGTPVVLWPSLFSDHRLYRYVTALLGPQWRTVCVDGPGFGRSDAPGGDVQETGASNFVLLNDRELLTKPLDGSFLPGVTRDSLLRLASALGYKVTERNFSVEEMLEWVKNGEAALSGTAAVLAPVGSLICRGETHEVADGQTGKNTLRLRDALLDIQCGRAQSGFEWLTGLDHVA